MTQLLKMKERKARGASFIMQDDVARFLGGGGEPDYNHRLFDPTIEFILLLRNAFLANSQNISQVLEKSGIPTAYDPEYFAEISLGAGLAASSRTPELPPAIKKPMAEYFEEMVGQCERFSTVDKLADDVERRIFKRSGKAEKSTGIQGVNKGMLRSIIDIIIKRNVASQAQQQGQPKQTLLGRVQAVAQKLTQTLQSRNTPKPPKRQNTLTARLNFFRRRMAALDNIDYQHQHDHTHNAPDDDHSHKNPGEMRQENLQVQEAVKITDPAKQAETKQPKDKTRQEILSSTQIDKTVKDKKVESKTSSLPPEQREKMEAQKQSEERVSNMKMEDAVKLLQNSGVKTTETAAPKLAVEKNVENLATAPNKNEKQRL